MMIVVKARTGKKGIDELLRRISGLGFKAHISKGRERTLVGVIGEGNKALLHRAEFESMSQVESVTPISKPYKLVSRAFKKDDTVVKVGGLRLGGGPVALMAGPCSVDTREYLLENARALAAAGVGALRGGAFKPRSSPYSFQGHGEAALDLLAEARRITGLPIVTEVMDTRQVPLVAARADMLQIGARNGQNFDLLREVGRARKPVLLKRGPAMTIEEWLMAAEHVLSEGNPDVVLCERGIRTFETATRNTLDLSAVPVLKSLTHLPVIVDPSHGVGVREFIHPMALAAVAAGADGVIVECHPHPPDALSDAHQALLPKEVAAMARDIRSVARALGRSMARPGKNGPAKP